MPNKKKYRIIKKKVKWTVKLTSTTPLVDSVSHLKVALCPLWTITSLGFDNFKEKLRFLLGVSWELGESETTNIILLHIIFKHSRQ